jgi:uncharacterized protein
MTWVNDVWRMLDREQLADIVGRIPSVLFATVSGAHLYGFASPDSDVDLRGVFLLPIEALVGLSEPAETLTVGEMVSGVEIDLVVHDLRKFARMMTRHNGYVLEQLYSPLVVVGGEDFAELQAIGHGCITRELYRHYQGFARSRRKLLGEPGATVKHLLYAYRVYMTGIRVLQGGGIETNLGTLNADFRLGQIDELVQRKRTGAEQQLLQAAELTTHNRELDSLERLLQSSYEDSGLPAEITVMRELNDFVVRARLLSNANPHDMVSAGPGIAETD